MIIKDKVDSLFIGDDYLTCEYTKQPIKESEVKSWRDKGYYHESFTGGLYSSRNTMPRWTKDISDSIGLDNCGYTFYKMETLDIMPPHFDHFDTYSRIFNINKDKVFRAIVFLEDWKPGHYFEYNKIGNTTWSKGEYVMYSHDIEHAASNIGIEPRYTLQITGTIYKHINFK